MVKHQSAGIRPLLRALEMACGLIPNAEPKSPSEATPHAVLSLSNTAGTVVGLFRKLETKLETESIRRVLLIFFVISTGLLGHHS